MILWISLVFVVIAPFFTSNFINLGLFLPPSSQRRSNKRSRIVCKQEVKKVKKKKRERRWKK
jgi:predicted membrane protein